MPRVIGASLDIFRYRDEINFYMFFNEPESMRDSLAVFVLQGCNVPAGSR